MKGYIYKIENDITRKVYIGSTINPESRMLHHFAALRAGKHHSIHLQRSFDKYGEEHFHFSVIDECDADDRLQVEQRYLDELKPFDEKSYNVSPIATNCVLCGEKNGMWGRRGEDNPNFGRKHTDEAKEKMSKNSHLRHRTPEENAKISKTKREKFARGELVPWIKGKHLSEEQKKYFSEIHKKPIVCYDLSTGAFVNEYLSRLEAEEETGISKSSISSVCQRRVKSTGGFIWRFKDDVYNSDLKNIYEIEDRPKRKPRTNKKAMI